jgi:hypothetical protein
MNKPDSANASQVTSDRAGDDSALLALERQFNELSADLLAVKGANEMLRASSIPQLYGNGADTKQVEAILERLYPIERGIMQTPACTRIGLGVKARHAAHVLSHHWEAAIDAIDWEGQAVRLLIEAVCDFADTPLIIRNSKDDE